MKIINEKLWDIISHIDYNRPGNRYRFAAYDYEMCDDRIVLAVFDAENAIDDMVPEEKLPCVDCLLWSANESSSDWYWSSFIELLLALAEDNTAWVYHEHSLRSRAARGEETCLIYPEASRYIPHDPVDLDKLSESERTAVLTDWMDDIQASINTVCVYNAQGDLNRHVITRSAWCAVKAYERTSEIYMDYDEEFDETNKYTPECGWMYYR